MGIARGFRPGNNPAVPQLKSKKIKASARGKDIVQREKDGTMARAFDLLAGLPGDLATHKHKKDRPQGRKGM